MTLTDHVNVDTSLLREMGRRLGELSAMLGRAKQDGGRDVAATAQRDLSKAMEEFVDNWRVHRERLIESANGHQKLVVAAAAAYERLDRDMAAALDQKTSGPSK